MAGGNSELLVVMCGLLLALNGWRDEGGGGIEPLGEHCAGHKTVNSGRRTTAGAHHHQLMCTCPPSGQKHNFLQLHKIEHN